MLGMEIIVLQNGHLQPYSFLLEKAGRVRIPYASFMGSLELTNCCKGYSYHENSTFLDLFTSKYIWPNDMLHGIRTIYQH